MLKTGLCSITFRKLGTDAIIELAADAGLDGIEWGGDVHVVPGDPQNAAAVGRATRDAGLAVSSYGSYYRSDAEAGAFAPVLEAAKALEAPVIRVWAGRKGSADADPEYRAEVIAALRKAVNAASAEGRTVALEYHGNTLTDTRTSAHQLLREVDHPGLKLYWQPRNGGRLEDNWEELNAALPHLSHIHVFHWQLTPEGKIDRRPLSEGENDWREYLDLLKRDAADRFCILEFVRNDDPDQLRYDAATLKALL